MRRRVRAWLEETHGAVFELTRHFLFGLFDNEAAAEPGEWVKTAIGALAVALSAGILVFSLYGSRYNALWSQGTPALFRGAMREDELTLIAICMGVTALATILQWQSLFPNRRDCLAFGGWPVSAGEIFTAKFFSLLLIFLAFVLAATVIPGVLFAVVTSFPWRPNPSMAANVGGQLRGCGRRLRLRILQPAGASGDPAEPSAGARLRARFTRRARSPVYRRVGGAAADGPLAQGGRLVSGRVVPGPLGVDARGARLGRGLRFSRRFLQCSGPSR